jgi:hypothetical protein
MKTINLCLAAVAGGLLLSTPAVAEDGMAVEEVVVTAERLEEYNPQRTPAVTMPKRADNLITIITVICDTREDAQRKTELKATLRNLIRAAAQDKSIALGLGDEVISNLDETMFDAIIGAAQKPDTSQAKIVIKTPVSGSDTFDAAAGRIRAFVKATPKVGRTEVLINGSWELTIVGPGQYRGEITRLVAQDSRRTAATFGEGYGVEVTGLQLPVSWYQSGPLDLALFIPYTMTVKVGK